MKTGVGDQGLVFRKGYFLGPGIFSFFVPKRP